MIDDETTNDYICDDRLDAIKLVELAQSLSEEEFIEYINKIQQEEQE